MADREDIREEIRDKISASEARTETKFAELGGKLNLVLSKIDGMNHRFGEIREDVSARMTEIRSDIRSDVRDDGRATRANYWLGVAAIVAAMFALAALFPPVVDLGMKLGELKHTQEAPRAAAPAKIP